MSNKDYPIYPGWTVVTEIGRGSYGVVYEIERRVGVFTEKAALKHITIPQNEGEIRSMRQMGMDDASVTGAFADQKNSILMEYKLMSDLGAHSNVVNCHDICEVSQADGMGWEIFIRMELLQPLSESLKTCSGEAATVRLGIDLCSALMLCEKKNILHRDIKPQNIFVSENGDYKLGDFGIARAIESASHGASTMGVGTNNYMAPEVKYGEDNYSHTADIYSLGLVLYWLLNEQRLPFCPLPPEKLTINDLQNARSRRMRGEALPLPKNGRDELKSVVLKACAFDPKARYQSAAEMKKALECLAIPEGAVLLSEDIVENDAAEGIWNASKKTLVAESDAMNAFPAPDDLCEVVEAGETADSPVREIETEGASFDGERTEPLCWKAKRKELGEEVEREARRSLEEQELREMQAVELMRLKAQKLREKEALQKKLVVGGAIVGICILLVLAAVIFSKGIRKPTPPKEADVGIIYDDGTSATTDNLPADNRTPDGTLYAERGVMLFEEWMEPLDYTIKAPRIDSYLPELVQAVVCSEKGAGVYAKAGPSPDSYQFTKYVRDGAEVTVMAVQGNYALIRENDTGRVVWIGKAFVGY